MRYDTATVYIFCAEMQLKSEIPVESESIGKISAAQPSASLIKAKRGHEISHERVESDFSVESCRLRVTILGVPEKALQRAFHSCWPPDPQSWRVRNKWLRKEETRRIIHRRS